MRLSGPVAAVTAAVSLTAALLCSCGHTPAPDRPRPAPRPPAVAAGAFLPGVFTPGIPYSYAPVARFATQTGTSPRIVLWYSGLDQFRPAFARQAAARGATPMVQVNPGTMPMSAVADGRIDRWLNAYAAAVRAYGKPLIIGFAAEPNGTWDSWGYGHTSPSAWIAAWRHMVDVFRRDGADNVIWLWTVNAVNLRATRAPLRLWWPGSAYVTWAGIDGYYYTSSATWGNVFAPTIKQVRTITSDPVLISETAVAPSPAAPAQITGLFAGARAAGCIGVVWFDQRQDNPPYHDDWRLEDTPADMAAYGKAAR